MYVFAAEYDVRIDPDPNESQEEDLYQPISIWAPRKNNRRLRMSEKIVPHENDILMGRGGKNNQHVGNEKLRALAREQCETYRVSSKKGKSYISRDLVRQVREMSPPGRFLKKNQLGEWEDVGDDIGREKASQVLRDAVATITTPVTTPSSKHGIDSGRTRPPKRDEQQEHRRSYSAPAAMRQDDEPAEPDSPIPLNYGEIQQHDTANSSYRDDYVDYPHPPFPERSPISRYGRHSDGAIDPYSQSSSGSPSGGYSQHRTPRSSQYSPSYGSEYYASSAKRPRISQEYSPRGPYYSGERTAPDYARSGYHHSSYSYPSMSYYHPHTAGRTRHPAVTPGSARQPPPPPEHPRSAGDGQLLEDGGQDNDFDLFNGALLESGDTSRNRTSSPELYFRDPFES